MDRKYLEEHLSAYLDNELEPKKLREFEQALKAYPDLQEQIARLQRLNLFARESEVPMPADGYFDNLAERIEARIEREYPKERGRIVDFLLARRKTVAIVSSVAAVLLITVISVEFYGPEREMYPGQIQRTIELKQEEPKKSEPAQTPQTGEKDEAPRMMVRPPAVYGDTALGEVKAKEVPVTTKPAKAATAKDESMLKSSRQGVHQPSATKLDEAGSENLSTRLPAAETMADTVTTAIESAPAESTTQLVVESKSDKVETVTETKDLLSPQSIVENQNKPAVQTKKLKPNTATSEPQAVSGESAGDQSSSGGYHFSYDESLEPPEIIPDSLVEKYAIERERNITRQTSPEEVYLRLKAELAKGAYRKHSILIRPGTEESVRAWVDSFTVLGPARWWAEEMYRRALANEHFTAIDVATCRAYVEHYLEQPEAVDSALWRERLNVIEDIYQQNQRRRER